LIFGAIYTKTSNFTPDLSIKAWVAGSNPAALTKYLSDSWKIASILPLLVASLST